MHKQITMFKSVIQGMESFFHFDSACSTVIAKEALLECLKWVGQIEDAAKAAQAMSEEAKDVVEEIESVLPDNPEASSSDIPQ